MGTRYVFTYNLPTVINAIIPCLEMQVTTRGRFEWNQV